MFLKVKLKMEFYLPPKTNNKEFKYKERNY